MVSSFIGLDEGDTVALVTYATLFTSPYMACFSALVGLTVPIVVDLSPNYPPVWASCAIMGAMAVVMWLAAYAADAHGTRALPSDPKDDDPQVPWDDATRQEWVP
jgi:hypothetical protein